MTRSMTRLRKFLDGYPVGFQAPFTRIRDDVFDHLGTKTPNSQVIAGALRGTGFRIVGSHRRKDANCRVWRRLE